MKQKYWLPLVIVVTGIGVWVAISSVSSYGRSVDTRSARAAILLKKIQLLNQKYQALNAELENLPPVRLSDIAAICEGRLTLASGTAVTTTDQTAKSTVYFTPYYGNSVSVYDGTNWQAYTLSEISLSLSGLSNNTNYDVFLYVSGGNLTLELSSAWSSDTARTDALVLQDGIYVKSGATDRRYLGTLRTTSTTTTEDSVSKRFLWNYLNRKRRNLSVTESTDSWSYSSSSWRAANNSTSNRVEYVAGMNDNLVTARSMFLATASSGSVNYASSGIGIDSTSANSATLRGSGTSTTSRVQVWSEYAGYPGIGYHYIQWLEAADATAITIYGDNGDSVKFSSGLIAEVPG